MSSEEKHQILEAVKEEKGRDNEARLSYFVIGILAGVLVAIVLMMAWQKSKEYKISALDQTILDTDKDLKSLGDQESQSVGLLKQLGIFSVALSGKYKYSSFLNDLRSYQYKKSKWTNLSFSKDAVVIGAQADSFEDVAKSVAALKNMKAIKEINLSSASLDPQTNKIDFEMTVVIDLTSYKTQVLKQGVST